MAPTIVYYESTFFNILIESILSKNISIPQSPTVKFGFSKSIINLPHVLIHDSILPIINVDNSEYIENSKSKEIKVMMERADRNFLLRYFKITPVNLNLSYHNPENNVIPDINEFNGKLNGIIYQDLTTDMDLLISKLISDISLDILPQFLKHLVGLGKININKEKELDQWLHSNDDKKSATRKKELLFGKSLKK